MADVRQRGRRPDAVLDEHDRRRRRAARDLGRPARRDADVRRPPARDRGPVAPASRGPRRHRRHRRERDVEHAPSWRTSSPPLASAHVSVYVVGIESRLAEPGALKTLATRHRRPLLRGGVARVPAQHLRRHRRRAPPHVADRVPDRRPPRREARTSRATVARPGRRHGHGRRRRDGDPRRRAEVVGAEVRLLARRDAPRRPARRHAAHARLPGALPEEQERGDAPPDPAARRPGAGEGQAQARAARG